MDYWHTALTHWPPLSRKTPQPPPMQSAIHNCPQEVCSKAMSQDWCAWPVQPACLPCEEQYWQVLLGRPQPMISVRQARPVLASQALDG